MGQEKSFVRYRSWENRTRDYYCLLFYCMVSVPVKATELSLMRQRPAAKHKQIHSISWDFHTFKSLHFGAKELCCSSVTDMPSRTERSMEISVSWQKCYVTQLSTLYNCDEQWTTHQVSLQAAKNWTDLKNTAWSDEFGGMISWNDAAMHEQFRLVSSGVMV